MYLISTHVVVRHQADNPAMADRCPSPTDGPRGASEWDLERPVSSRKTPTQIEREGEHSLNPPPGSTKMLAACRHTSKVKPRIFCDTAEDPVRACGEIGVSPCRAKDVGSPAEHGSDRIICCKALGSTKTCLSCIGCAGQPWRCCSS